MRFKKGHKVYAVQRSSQGREGWFIVDDISQLHGGSYLLLDPRDNSIYNAREAELCKSQFGHEEDPCKLCGYNGWESELKSLSEEWPGT